MQQLLSYPYTYSPRDRGLALLDDMQRLQNKNLRLIEIECGDYDLGPFGLMFPENCEVRGKARKGTRLLSAWKLTMEHLCTFEVQNGTRLVSMTLVSTAGMKDQVCLVGPKQQTANDKPINCEFVDLHSSSKSWCYYFWHLPSANRIRLINCYGEAANVALGACQSSGIDAQYVDAFGCHFVVKPELSDQGGAVTDPVFGGSAGVVQRGGTVRLFDTLIEAAGEKTAPRLVGVTDYFNDGSADNMRLELHNVHIRLTKTDQAKEVFDLDIRKASYITTGGSGYQPSGVYTKSPQTIKPAAGGAQ